MSYGRAPRKSAPAYGTPATHSNFQDGDSEATTIIDNDDQSGDVQQSAAPATRQPPRKQTARKSVIGFGGPAANDSSGDENDSSSSDDGVGAANAGLQNTAQHALAQMQAGRGNPLRAPPSNLPHARAPQGRAAPRLGQPVQMRRHRKVLRESIKGITKPSIRRLARRGGVKRIGASIYEEARFSIKTRVEAILEKIAPILDHTNRKTVTTADVVFALKTMGNPVYGFDEGSSDE